MANPLQIQIVIPCFNEADRLDCSQFQEFVQRTLGQVAFLFVDDGSTDGTPQVLETLRRACPEAIAIHRLPQNRGKAEAVRQGFLQALQGGVDFVGYWDADLATPLDTVPAFCELLVARPDVDMVFGARVQLLGRSIERRALRHYLGRVFSTLVSLGLDLKVYDTQCGAKLFRATPQLLEIFSVPFSSRWLFDVEIVARLIQLARAGGLAPVERTIYEYPLPRWRDVSGSKLRYWDFAVAIFDLLRIYRRYLGGSKLSRPSPGGASPR